MTLPEDKVRNYYQTLKMNPQLRDVTLYAAKQITRAKRLLLYNYCLLAG